MLFDNWTNRSEQRFESLSGIIIVTRCTEMIFSENTENATCLFAHFQGEMILINKRVYPLGAVLIEAAVKWEKCVIFDRLIKITRRDEALA